MTSKGTRHRWSLGILVALLLLTAALAAAASQAEPAAGPAPPPAEPHWAYSKFMWAALALAFSVLGTSWAQARIGMAGAGAMAEKPELSGTIIVLIAIPETMVILGFVIAAMIIFAK